MPNKETTTKFKVDISELKKNITEANRLIRLNNSEFKAASAGMDKWSDNANGLTAKLKQLNGNLDQEKVKLKSLEEQYKLVCDAQGKDSKGAQDLLIKINNQKAAISKTESQINTYTAKLKDIEEQNKKSESATEKLSTAIKNQEEKLEKLKSKYAEVILTEGKNSDKAKELKSEIEKLSTELYKNKSKLNDAEGAAEKYDKSLKSTKDSTKTAEKSTSAFKVALGNLAADGITKVVSGLKDIAKASYDTFEEVDEGFDTIIKKTGASGETAKSLETNFKDVAKNVVADFSEIGTAIGEINTRFGFAGQNLTDASTKFLQFAKINDVDVNTSVAETAKAMANANIELSKYAEVLDLVTLASQKTGVSVETILGDMQKYGSTFKNLNISYKDQIGLIAQFEASGVDMQTALSGLRKSVQNWGAAGKDSNKEFAKAVKTIKNAKSPTDATKKAIEVFGKKAGPELATAIKEGKFEYEKMVKALKNSNGTVKKTYTNIEDGNSGVIKSIQNAKVKVAEFTDDLLKKYGPQISDVIDDVEKGGEKAVTWIIENLDKIIPILKGIGTELLIVFAANKISSFTSNIAGMINTFRSLKTATEGATTAQKLLNIAQASNPIGAVITVVGTLITAFLTLTDVMGGAESKSKEADFTPETTEAKRQVDELTQSWEDFKTARDNAVQDTSSEWDYYETLWQELDGLVGKNKEVKETDKARAEFILNTLNKALGKEIGKIKGLKIEYNNSAKAVENLMQKEKARAMLGAYKHSYTDAIKNTAEGSDTKKAYDTNHENYIKAKKEFDDANKSYDKLKKQEEDWDKKNKNKKYEVNPYAGKLADAIIRKNKAKTNLYGNGEEDGALKTWEKSRDAYNEALNTITNYENLNEAILSGNNKKVNNYLGAISGNFKSFGAATYEELMAQRDSYEKAYKEINQKFKDGAEGITKEQVEQARFLKKQAKKEVTKYQQSTGTWIKDFHKSVSQKVKQGGTELINEVDANSGATAKKTEQGFEKVTQKGVSGGKKFINSTSKAISDNSGKVSKSAKDAMTGAANSAKGVKTYSIGSNFINGIISAFKNNSLLSKLVDGATNIAKKAYGTVKKWLGIESPSKKTKELGKYFMMGFDVGADEESKKTQANLKKRFGDVVKSAQSSVTGTDLPVNLNVPNSINRSKNSGQANSGNTVVNNYYYHNYTQNNTSPKALDELTIYRQSKNLFNLNK